MRCPSNIEPVSKFGQITADALLYPWWYTPRPQLRTFNCCQHTLQLVRTPERGMHNTSVLSEKSEINGHSEVMILALKLARPLSIVLQERQIPYWDSYYYSLVTVIQSSIWLALHDMAIMVMRARISTQGFIQRVWEGKLPPKWPCFPPQKTILASPPCVSSNHFSRWNTASCIQLKSSCDAHNWLHACK